MKYLFLSLILFLTSCSLSKEDTVYWNKDLTIKANEEKKLSKILKEKQLHYFLREKYGDYKTMSFDEFNLFLKEYSKSRFVKILKTNSLLSTNDVINTNNCSIVICKTKYKNRVIIFSVIDNLIKGGAGQAIQNMNIKYGFNETKGLT